MLLSSVFFPITHSLLFVLISSFIMKFGAL